LPGRPVAGGVRVRFAVPGMPGTAKALPGGGTPMNSGLACLVKEASA